MKMLIVDDVGYSRHYHARMLQKYGHDVLVAEGGPQALQMLERDSSIDAVLTDLLMRDMDGIELFNGSQQINRMTDTGTAEAPAFILMTAVRPGGNAQQRDLDKLQLAKKVGFVDVLFKPIEPEQLKRALETIEYIRGHNSTHIDTLTPIQRVRETVDRITAARNTAVAEMFLSELQDAVHSLEQLLAPSA